MYVRFFDRYADAQDKDLLKMKAEIAALEAEMDGLYRSEIIGLAMNLDSTESSRCTLEQHLLANHAQQMHLKKQMVTVEDVLHQALRDLALVEETLNMEHDVKHETALQDCLQDWFRVMVAEKRQERETLGEGRWRGLKRNGARRHRRSSPEQDSRGAR